MAPGKQTLPTRQISGGSDDEAIPDVDPSDVGLRMLPWLCDPLVTPIDL